MKKKNKILAVVEIAIVLCSVFLVALPAIAAEQNPTMQKAGASTITTTSADNYVLGIYGNANEDDAIDMRDLTYVKLIFFGKKPETELADAKYDGKINPLDFIQIKLIIVGKEKELTIVDSADRIVTVKEPAENLMVLICEQEVIRLLGAQDRVIGVHKWVAMLHSEDCPEMSTNPNIGSFSDPDYEKILEIADQTKGQDIVITYAEGWAENIEEKLEPVEGIKVVKFNFHKPEIFAPQLRQLAIMLGKEEECSRYFDWRDAILDQIKERVKEISPKEKVKVYADCSGDGHFDTANDLTAWGAMINLAGGENIAADLTPKYPKVDPEWVLTENPDVIISHARNAQNVVGLRLGYYSETTTDDYPKLEEARQELMDTSGINGSKAVKDGRVYFIADDLLFGPQQPIGAMYLAKWFYPERFADLNPQEQNRKYYEEFMDLEYRGIYVYPEK